LTDRDSVEDRTGRTRYLGCEWDLPDGEMVVLEVDGFDKRWVLRTSTVSNSPRLAGQEVTIII
jgi:hypothetical protein